MLLGLCALSVLLTVPHMQAGSTLLLMGARQHQPPSARLGAARSPMLRRCTPVWSWPSRRCSLAPWLT